MIELPAIVAVSLLAAALACYGLGFAIYRRTERRTDTIALGLMLTSLGTQYLLLGMGHLMSDTLHFMGPKTHYLLVTSGDLLKLLFFALCGHFLIITHRGMGDCSDDLLDFRPFGIITQKRLGDWLFKLFIYGAALAIGSVYAWKSFHTLQTYEAWQSGMPATPSDSKFLGFASGIFFGIFVGIQISTLTSIYTHLPEPEKKGKFARWFFEEYAAGNHTIMTLGLADTPAKAAVTSTSANRDEWKAFLALAVGSVTGMILATQRSKIVSTGSGYAALASLVLTLLPFLVLLPFIYYKMRFVFWDVLIKRGVLAGGLLGSSVLYFGGLLWLLQRRRSGHEASQDMVMLWMGSVVFVAIWIVLYRRLARALDQYLFHRPDYGQLVLEIGKDLRSFADGSSLISYVTKKLRTALSASYVRFADKADFGLFSDSPADGRELSEPGAPDNPPQEIAASVALATDDRHFGYLIFGRRPRGQYYQSEDLGFLVTISNQLAGLLQNFALRDERDAQARREQELRELATRSEVKALRAQINPHFLFNTLNTIADLTQEDPKTAESTIINLARVFRFTLEATKRDTVPLGEELDFVKSYLEIERTRFEDKLRYEIHAPDSLRYARIPPMLVQPLVENAIKHGIAPKVGGGHVIIRAYLRNERIEISVEDNGVGFQAAQPGTNHSGIGLSNVQERIEKLFGPGHWQLTSTAGVGTIIKIELGQIENSI